MIRNLYSTTIVVPDQDEALAFYRDVLGWVVRDDAMMGPGMRWLTIAPEGAETAVVLGQPDVYGRPAPDPAHPAGTGISLIAEDVDAFHAEFTAKGVTFTMDPSDMPWGARGTSFCDPFGNEFFVSGPMPIA